MLSYFRQLIQDPTPSRLPNFRDENGSRVQDLSTIQPLSQSSSISNLIVNVLNFIIFVLSAFSILIGLISLILAIVFSIQKNKNANIAWIVFAVCGVVLLLSVIIFTVISLYFSFATTADLSSTL